MVCLRFAAGYLVGLGFEVCLTCVFVFSLMFGFAALIFYGGFVCILRLVGLDNSVVNLRMWFYMVITCGCGVWRFVILLVVWLVTLGCLLVLFVWFRCYAVTLLLCKVVIV